MPSILGNTVYNARIPDMPLPSLRLTRAAGLLLILWATAASTATDWRSPNAQLARKIAAVTGPGAVALEVVNRSSLSQAETPEIRRGLMAELSALGVSFVQADQAAATVQVSLSENLQSYVWVAEIRLGNNEPAVVMVSTPRSQRASEERTTALLTIRKVLLWEDQSRILDVALPNPQHMIVLEADSVLLYGLQNGKWQRDQTLSIAHANPWPRDLRGRLILRKDHLFDAYLPGVFCRSSSTAPLAANCRDSDDPWPLASDPFALSGFFARTRNFFTGVLSPGIQKQNATSPFYSAAPLPRDKYTLWIFATVDGQIHMLDGVADQTAGKLTWGSDIATVRSGCGLGWQILASAAGDAPRDMITAFEVNDREPVAVSQPNEFSGRITALWTDSDGNGAVVVVHDAETEKYEAYRLSITCSQ